MVFLVIIIAGASLALGCLNGGETKSYTQGPEKLTTTRLDKVWVVVNTSEIEMNILVPIKIEPMVSSTFFNLRINRVNVMVNLESGVSKKASIKIGRYLLKFSEIPENISVYIDGTKIEKERNYIISGEKRHEVKILWNGKSYIGNLTIKGYTDETTFTFRIKAGDISNKTKLGSIQVGSFKADVYAENISRGIRVSIIYDNESFGEGVISLS
ncbi:hypothetical protein [Pyrococcus yayanosii]|nr:hypothetical protein [Pyrococcus yayanosii]